MDGQTIGIAGIIIGVVGTAFGFWSYSQGSKALRSEAAKLERATKHVRLLVTVLANALEEAGHIGLARDEHGEIVSLELRASGTARLPGLGSGGAGHIANPES
jgi:hypothetical protein